MRFVEQVQAGWQRISGDDELLASFARDLGFALRDLDDDALLELRNLLALSPPDVASRRGLMQGLIEMIDGCRDALAAQAATGRAETAVREAVAHQIIMLLAPAERTTTELARLLRKEDEEISRALGKLREVALIESARDLTDGRRRWHRLSLRGKALHEQWLSAARQRATPPATSAAAARIAAVPPQPMAAFRRTAAPAPSAAPVASRRDDEQVAAPEPVDAAGRRRRVTPGER